MRLPRLVRFHGVAFRDSGRKPDGKSIRFVAATCGKRDDDDVYRLDLETGASERLREGNGYTGGLKLLPGGKTAANAACRCKRCAVAVEILPRIGRVERQPDGVVTALDSTKVPAEEDMEDLTRQV